jgi:hypothetical protein
LIYWDGYRWTHEPGKGPVPARAPRSRLRRIGDWVLTFAAVIGLMAVVLPFDAATAKTPSITVSPGSGIVGTQVTVSGSGFASRAQLQLTWDGTSTGLVITSTTQGRFSVALTVPSASMGPHTVAAMEVTSTGGGRPPKSSTARTLIVAATFTVVSAVSASPSTGATPVATPTTAPQVSASPIATATPRPSTTPAPTIAPTPSIVANATPAPTATPASAVPHLLFGLGQEADGALRSTLLAAAPIHMLTSWYNGPNDLSWIMPWRYDLVPAAYASGRALHLIVWSGGGSPTTFSTAYGAACGQPYPLSDRFLGDMQSLAQTFAGPTSSRLYVTLFTEFQTYPCSANEWNPSPQVNAYYRALKDRYLEAVAVFHRYAPNSRVSLGWGGWQTRWDNPATGGGRSMFQYFADVMQASDFESFQAMQGDSNVSDVLAMTKTLGAYGPVMLAHYGPDGGSQAVFDADVHTMLTDSYLSQVTAAGLFAWSFMDDRGATATADDFTFVTNAITRYGD